MGELFSQILHDRQLTERQKQGVVVCIPKQASPKIPEDYRPLTLFNTDYKILARLIAARVRPFLSELLHPSQHCGIPYLLTPWSRVLLEKLASLQLVKKFPAFYGTRRFLTALTSARHLSLS